jgi:hypothetical protein
MVVNERPVFAVTHGPNERSEHINQSSLQIVCD